MSWVIIIDLSGIQNGSLVRTIFSADEMNNFYCTLAENTATNTSIKEDPTFCMKNIDSRISFFLALKSIEEIIDTIKGAKIKILRSGIIVILAEAINISFSTGILLEFLKITFINPLFKWEDAELFSNLKPILLVPSVGGWKTIKESNEHISHQQSLIQ